MTTKNATARVAARLRRRRQMLQFESAMRNASSPAMQQELVVSGPPQHPGAAAATSVAGAR
jgi:3-oxoacyl-(acyl-carrier-protein) synthase